ncbi:MAG: hypothetical protein LAQ30_25495 [Acidobacteriia bacterium]|nr:hypothetical protein [Terriglobia bacterium]
MELFVAAVLACAAILLGGILLGGIAVMVHARTGRRERREMRRHIQRLELADRE